MNKFWYIWYIINTTQQYKRTNYSHMYESQIYVQGNNSETKGYTLHDSSYMTF